ncbi:MAG: PKD domain-containing protein [Bacteroidales bacterium]|nr:PKD domain-containing protein [Bacteroidales bacterium]
MNRFAKALLIAVVLIAMPMKHWGQTVRNNVIEIELASISNPDYRYCLLSRIANDNNISYIIDEETSSVLLSSRDDWDEAQFQYYFDHLRANAESEFGLYTHAEKESQGTSFLSWKESLPQDLFVLLFRQMLIENPSSRDGDGNQTCATSDPFCTTDVVTFHVDTNPSGSCEPGPSYGCLSSYIARRPYWFHMKIGVAGNFQIKMTNSANVDIDYCCWGPFNDPVTPCPNQLTNIIDCGSSSAATEYCNIPSTSQVGQYYIMVITKWNTGTATDITFQKVPNSGPGETDCGILPGIADNDGPYCVGETIHLTVNQQSGATYSWTGPGGFTSTLPNPTRPNCTMAMAGTYTCVTTVDTHTTTATTDVVVYPKPTANFTATTVCKGNPTQFTSTSTTNPSGQQITSYQWNFGDNTPNSSQQNPTHTYANAGNYQVTLTVGCGNGHCTSTKTQTVTVYAAPIANAGPDQTIPYGGTAQLSGSGGAGQFNYQWSPANMVVNANAQNTQTVPLTSDQTYTLTVSNPQGQCTSSDQVTIHISGSAMTVSAGPNISICQGGSGQIYVNAGGGTGNITYSWTPTTGLSNPNISNPIASPSQTTTYTCHVSDGTTSQNVSVTVTVNDVIVEDEYHSICPGDIYYWHGTPYDTPDTYQFDTITSQGCDKTIYLHLDQYPSYDETTITVERCYGESYTFYGTPYTAPGHYEVQHTDHTVLHGCDSIVRLDLTIWPENQIEEIPVTLCPDQLPYYFEEDPNQIPLYAGLHIFHPEDEHGCERTVWVDIEVSEYYIPPTQVEYVCYQDTPSFTWEINGQTYHEDIFVQDTLPTEACEGIFKLDLHFQQIPEVEHTYDTVCDSYYWPVNGQHYGNGLLGTQVIEDEYRIPMNPFPCDRVYQLHLTINKSDNTAHQEYDNECDSIPFEWFGNTIYFKEDGIYTFPNEEYPDGQTALRCDTTMTVTVTNMKYTPKPVIDCSDQNVENPHWPITATEFNVNRYTYFASDPKSDATWINEQCEWSISKESWRIVPSDDNRSCTVYAMDWVPDSICLSFKAVNRCSESEIAEYWLHPSFYGIEEQEAYPAVVDIIPNPNNGQMQLRFENMEGKLNIKVYTMSGGLVDSFELKTIGVGETYDYSMKRLVNGVYFFTITDGKRSVTKKVVIIH